MKLIADLDAYAFRKGWPKLFVVFVPFFYMTSWPIIVYRFNNFVHYKVKIPLLRQLILIICFILQRLIEVIFTIEISPRARIDGGLFIAHLGNIVISAGSVIGSNASIHQGVTFGGAGHGEYYGDPTIGDNIYVGAGAKIIGKIVVGDNVMIGANSVLTKNTPNNVTVGGIPAKILNNNGSFDFIHFRKKQI